MIDTREIRVAHMACGSGGGAKGFNDGEARVGNMEARFRCIGGIDVDAAAIRDFERLAGVRGTVLDMFTLEQYVKFHGRMPPAGWRQATVQDIHTAFQNEHPHIIFASWPCKGFSGLLSEQRSRSDKYQALNELVVHGMFLTLEAYKDDPVEFYLIENVPRIATRGRHLIDQISQLLEAYGYAFRETTHDCGELGELAQHRNRWLGVARFIKKIPPNLYQPAKRPVRAVGSVLGRMHLPGDPAAGPMHRIPNLNWKTWVRLAFVEAGSDWRSLQKLRVAEGVLQDFALAPDCGYPTVYGVNQWGDPAPTVTANSRPGAGAFSIADPRIDGHEKSVQMGVRAWDQPAATVTGNMWVGSGPNAIADPRIDGVKHNNCFRVVRFEDTSPAVTGGTGPSAGGLAVADPRPANGWTGDKYRVSNMQEAAGTVIAESGTGNGAYAVADPRPGLVREKGDSYLTAGHYGVVPWDRPAFAVTGSGQHDNGRHSVADPRLPAPTDRLIAVIRSIDGTWHRPFTTLELAALQGLYDPDAEGAQPFVLDGNTDSRWREAIGNAVPPPAARAIASEIGRTLLLAWSGESFVLSSTPVWVQPIAIALSVDDGVKPS